MKELKELIENKEILQEVKGEALRQVNGAENGAIRDLLAGVLTQAMLANPAAMLYLMAGPEGLNGNLMTAMRIAFATGVVIGRKLPKPE